MLTSGTSGGGPGGGDGAFKHGCDVVGSADAVESEKMTLSKQTAVPIKLASLTVKVTSSVVADCGGIVAPLRLKPITVLEGPACAVISVYALVAPLRAMSAFVFAFFTSNWYPAIATVESKFTSSVPAAPTAAAKIFTFGAVVGEAGGGGGGDGGGEADGGNETQGVYEGGGSKLVPVTELTTTSVRQISTFPPRLPGWAATPSKSPATVEEAGMAVPERLNPSSTFPLNETEMNARASTLCTDCSESGPAWVFTCIWYPAKGTFAV